MAPAQPRWSLASLETINLAVEQARSLGQASIGPEHLILAALQHREVSIHVMAELGLDPRELYYNLRRALMNGRQAPSEAGP